MIFSTSLKKSIFISALGHITLFSIFSFSFGYKIPKVDYTGVSFWGAILQSSDLISRENLKSQDTKEIFMKNFNTKPIKKIAFSNNLMQFSKWYGVYTFLYQDKTNREYPCLSSYYLKPAAILKLNEDKIIFVQKKTPRLLSSPRKAQAIMFYPLLPYHFLLYFKDRQVAHIELMFKIISSPKTNSIAVKRKISSGNLEADLLAMRYISHYLFIQQAGFPMNDWQTVKIELSPKDDKH